MNTASMTEARPDANASHVALRVDDVDVRAGSTTLLSGVSLTVPAGALVVIAGGSGAGKTTLLEVMAGLRPPSRGTITIGREQRMATAIAGSGHVGVVPQDDIIHRDLPLRRTLLHAARLKLGKKELVRAEDRVDEVLDRLSLTARADVRVAALSGGQRKRASIAVELLTDPDVLFLDEPTSGLDPVSAAEVIDTLRALTGRGMSVVVTTHDPAEIDRGDLVVFLAAGGRLCFAGTPDDARAHFAVDDIAAVYPLLSMDAESWARRWSDSAPRQVPVNRSAEPPISGRLRASGRRTASRARQWRVLTSRSAEVMVRNRLTLAILLGSPALVITMMAVLFPAGGFEEGDRAGLGPTQTAFWMAFCAFFFGLTYGLLQIVTERAVLRRERFSGLSLSAYLASKIAVLLPVLMAVVGLLLAVLRLLDRLPAASWTTYGELLVTLALTAIVGLAIGLGASAAVVDSTQATLALPMICFPQVLFAGAVVPVNQMAGAGAGISVGMATRWSFESLGRTLGLAPGHAPGASPYQEAFTGSATAGWVALTMVIAIASAAAWNVLRTRTARVGLAR